MTRTRPCNGNAMTLPGRTGSLGLSMRLPSMRVVPCSTRAWATDDPARAKVTATARDPYAAVTVERDGRTSAVVTVTSEDGSRTRTYRITLVRR